jgi:hypothetical protein
MVMTRNVLLFVVGFPPIGLLVMVTACGGTNGQTTLTDAGGADRAAEVADFCNRLAEIRCENVTSCCEEVVGEFDSAACEARERTQCSSEYGEAAYAADTGAECIAEQETLTDCYFSPEDFPACSKLARPRNVAPSGACSVSGDCSSSAEEGGVCKDGECIRMPYTGEGDECDEPFSVCLPELHCVRTSLAEPQTCEPILALGMDCENDQQCETGVCDDSEDICAESTAATLCTRPSR